MRAQIVKHPLFGRFCFQKMLGKFKENDYFLNTDVKPTSIFFYLKSQKLVSKPKHFYCIIESLTACRKPSNV